MSKKLKKKTINIQPIALNKKKVKTLQKMNAVKLHIFSTQLTRLIDAIPDAVLLKNKEGRKLIANQLTESLFKVHDIDWFSKTDVSTSLTHLEPSASHAYNRLLASELKLALDNRQLKLYYQVQVNNNRQTLGAEALLRWEHPQHGLLTAEQFIPIAEQSDLILPIGTWVLQSACEQLKRWQSDPLRKKLQLAVNISPRQFAQRDFVAQLRQSLENTKINPKQLKLELTESLMLRNISKTIDKMNELQQLGIRFSMDNFGTGYSSLGQLKKLPIDQLNIDPFLLRDITIDSSDAQIVETIIAMTNKLKLKVIAKGVETEQQFACLKQLGCLAYQGHLFDQPMPLAEFEQLLGTAEIK